MRQILVFSFSLVTLEFSIHNFFKTGMLLEIFDAEFPYKLSYFDPLCLLNKIAAKTVKRSIGVKGWIPAFLYIKLVCNSSETRITFQNHILPNSLLGFSL